MRFHGKWKVSLYTLKLWSILKHPFWKRGQNVYCLTIASCRRAEKYEGIIGSAEALPILCVRYFWWERERGREKERERYRDRRKWRHHCRAKIGDEFTLPLPKLRTIGNEITRSLAKSSHFSFPLHTSRLSLHHCGAEIRNEITLSVAKKFRPLSRFRLSQMAQAARQVIENPRQMIKSCSVPSKNWIKLIPKTIGNRKRDCAWGGSGS